MKTFWLHGARDAESDEERAAMAEMQAECESLREVKARERTTSVEFTHPAAGLHPKPVSRSPSVASSPNSDRSKSTASEGPIGMLMLDRLK